MVNSYVQSLLAGSAAGTTVDVVLFPLDTIKTRLQSSQGFWKSGGFRGIYRGLGPAFVGSAPNAAIFFCTYDTTKDMLKTAGFRRNTETHMTAACLGETAACSVRVPIEVVKQRRQASGKLRVTQILGQIQKQEGLAGFYRGYSSTILREIPFSIIQFPLWEMLKHRLKILRKRPASPGESSLCGALAGGISAFLTTPLDVAKTRIMLAAFGSQHAKGNISQVWKEIMDTQGVQGLFAGALPRTLWISLGGAVFFGTYELVKSQLV